MKSICAWCFPNAPQGEETEQISHGICPQHMAQIQQEAVAYWRKEGREFKEELKREIETKNIIRDYEPT